MVLERGALAWPPVLRASLPGGPPCCPVRWKAPHSNRAGQSARGAPPVQTRVWVQPRRAPGSRLRHTGCAGGGGARCLGDRGQHRRLRLPAVRPGLQPRPWSTPCTASPWAAGARSRAGPSTSPPSVSAGCTWRGAPRPGRALVVKVRLGAGDPSTGGTFSGPFPLWLPRRGAGAASGRAAAGHHLLPGHSAKCIWFCLTWRE